MNLYEDEKWTKEYFNGNLSSLTTEEIIGNVDAKREWIENRHQEKLFININSYDAFTRKSTLFLFGRRGTGKTALIKMMCYEIDEKILKTYKYYSLIDSEQAYSDLSVQVSLSPLSQLDLKDLTIQLKTKWLWIIETAAMQQILTNNYDKIGTNNDLKAINSYLLAQGLLVEDVDCRKYEVIDPIKRLVESIVGEFAKISDKYFQVGTAIFKLSQIYFCSDFTTARKSLYNYLKNEKSFCVVIVDSIEPYEANDKNFKALTSALMEAALSLDNNSDYGVVCKAAFPSEIEPHMATLNISKSEPRSIFIRWGYGNLVSLLAKRYLNLIKENINDAEYKELDDPYIARNFLYEYLPRTMKTKVLDEFDTIANIIRHTQKKPRQVIYLVNTILTIAKNNGFSFKSIDEGTINDGIHARLDVPVKSTTDMYSLIYPKCLDITNAVLVDKNNIMSMSELDSFLKSAHNIAGKSVFPYEIKRMLFEIGAIGTVRKRMNYKENKQIVEVLYEYQIKNMLPYNEQSVIAVHPMFYTRLHIKVSNTEFIYPVPGEEVETTILKELNITLI